MLTLPKNEVKLNQDEFSCEEVDIRSNSVCEVIDENESDYTIKMSNLCAKNYCQAGLRIAWVLEMANSDSLIFEEKARAISLKIFTEEGKEIQVLISEVSIQPPLEGNNIEQIELQRKYNLIGSIDFLKFYMPPMSVTIYSAANMILELPHGIAYSLGDEMICTRELDNGEEVELPCDGVAIEDENGPVLRNVRILGLCGQYYVCF